MINISKSIGFCEGVNYTIKQTIEILKNYQNVYAIHPVIHNSLVVEKLINLGLKICDMNKIPNYSHLIVNAHGITLNELDQAISKNLIIHDLTCPFIKKVKNEIIKYNELGYKFLFLGDKNHAEIQAYTSYVKYYQVIDDLQEISIEENDKICVVSQSTNNVNKYKKIVDYLNNLFKKHKILVVFLNSICYTTFERQKDAIALSKNNDAILVFGDENSANSRQLFGICSKHNKFVYFVKSKEDLLKYNNYFKNKNLGIISGASIPKELVMEVLGSMSDEIKKNVVEENKESFEALLKDFDKKSSSKLRKGKVYEVEIIKADASGITVLNPTQAKKDICSIPINETTQTKEYSAEDYKSGDKIKCVYDHDNVFSIKKYEQVLEEEKYIERINAGEDFDIKIESVSVSKTNPPKYGLIGHIGTYEIYIPASHVKNKFLSKEELEKQVNKVIKVRKLPPKQGEDGKEIKVKGKRITCSHKIIQQEENQRKADEFWSKIHVGDIIEGVVKRYTIYGVFVSIDNYKDGLIKMPDIMWTKKKVLTTEEMKEVLEQNKTYKFIVNKADREHDQVGLSYKDLQKKPYEICAEKHPIGDVIHGKVVSITPNLGAFIEIEKNIDGMVHISEISNKHINNVEEVLHIGDEVDAVIKSYDNERISLSMKTLIKDEPKVENNVNTENKNIKDDVDTKKKSKKVKTDNTQEEEGQREFISNNGYTTIGDLLGNIFGNDKKDDNK